MLFPTRRPSRVVLRTVVPLIAVLTAWSTAAAQNGKYFPLKQNVAPGIAGGWAGTLRPGLNACFQHIRVEAPNDGSGLVTFYGDGGAEYKPMPAPAAVEILVGPVYRMKLSQMPEFPGAELFPTVELISRLHPPPGQERDFPVPLTFTDEEIRQALEGRLITKVVYLEQPSLAYPGELAESAPTRPVYRAEDALLKADKLGRPMAIIRLGRRSLPANSYEFSPAPPIRLTGPALPTDRSSAKKASPKQTIANVLHEQITRAGLPPKNSPLISNSHAALPPKPSMTRQTLPPADNQARLRVRAAVDTPLSR